MVNAVAAPSGGPHRNRLARALLSSKLVPPLIRGDAVKRTRLMALLEPRPAKLVLIQAPAGYGKTTLMVQWCKRLSESGEAFGWVNFDEQDNDPAHLLASLAPALARDAPEETDDLLELINQCAARNGCYTLFLDEVEALHEPQAMRVLEMLLDYSPANFHVVMATRSTPGLPLARLRVRGDLFELSAEALRFVRQEAAQFLYNRCDVQFSRAALDQLLDKTEGWPAVLQLVALSLARGKDRVSVMEHLSGSRAQMIEYLESDVLRNLPANVRAFLLDTSILSRLCAPLCDAVTGGSDSAALLQRLEAANLFLQPLDNAREWYRYHALFAEFLRAELRKHAPDRANELTPKAAQWCAASGLLAEAVDYSLQAGDPQTASALLEEYLGGQVGIARLPTISGWLSALPSEQVERRPRLLVAATLAQVFTQDCAGAARAVERLQRLSRTSDSPELYRRTLLALEPAFLALSGHLAQAMERAQAAWPQLDRSAAFERGGLANVLAYTCLAAGQHDEAQRYLREASLCHSRPPRGVVGLAYVARNAAIAEACLGNLRGATQILLSMGKPLMEHGPDGPLSAESGFLEALCSGACAGLMYEQDQVDEAEDWLERHARFRETIPTFDSLILGYLTEVRICLARDERNRADEVLQGAVDHGMRRALPRLACSMEWERVRIALVDGDVHRARIIASSLESAADPAVAPAFIHPDEEIEGTGIEQIRLLLHDAKSAQALACLQVQTEHAKRGLRRRRLVKLHILRSLALKLNGEREAALQAILEAARLAASMGAIRSFWDEGPLCKALLTELRTEGSVSEEHEVAAFLGRVLETFGVTTSVSEMASAAPRRLAPGLLSAREIDILQRLSQGYSNLAVAQQLFVSTNTIKWHLRQIYEKLGAKNRSQAIFLARQNKML